MKKRISEIQTFGSTVIFCFSLSVKASPEFTLLRLLGTVMPSVLTILFSVTGKYMIDLISGTGKVLNPHLSILGLSILMLFLSAFRVLLSRLTEYAQSMHEDIVNGKLSYDMMEKACNMDLEYFDNTESYNRLSASMRDASAVQFLVWNVISAVSAVISFAAVFLMLMRMNVLYGCLILAASVPSAAAAAKYTKQIYFLSMDQINEERKKSYLQSLTSDRRYAQSLRFYDAGALLCEKYRRIWKNLYRERRKVNFRRSLLTGGLECLPELVTAWIGYDLALQALSGMATIGDYSLYTGLVSQLVGSIYILSGAVTQIYDNQLKITNLKFLETFSNRVLDQGGRQLRRVETIEFVNVSFSYPASEKKILDHISFQIRKGERAALVGLNGAGKSTLIKLLLRFYDIDQGEIKINGIDIKEYKLHELRKNFSIYFQNELSYCFTLLENLTIADREHPDSRDAAKQAFAAGGAKDILKQAPKGLDTCLSKMFDEQGIELSGGQYQKLALARTFFRRHTALILDEPSSSLDPKAEHLLFEELGRFTEGKTVLFTSHRLSNVFLADRILVLENGMIIEDGTHSELIKENGRYAELYRYQEEHFTHGERAENSGH